MPTFADGCNTDMLSTKTMADALTQIKHALSIRQSDFFIAYGMGHSSRMLVNDLREHVDASVGLIADKQELLICDGMRTKIYESVNDIGASEIFDKVYCNFCQLPMRKQHHDSVMSLCYKLCAINGMVYIENMTNKDLIETFLHKMHIKKYWYMNHGYDLLFKKDSDVK